MIKTITLLLLGVLLGFVFAGVNDDRQTILENIIGGKEDA